MPQFFRIAQFVVLALAATFANAGGLIDGSSSRDILEVARGYGSASLEVDNVGEPMIKGRMNGTAYTVFFHNCDDGGVNCNVIRFYNYWSQDVSISDVHNWNEEQLFSKCYIDKDGDVVLEMTANLFGGVSQQNLDDTFDWWRLMLEKFEKEVL